MAYFILLGTLPETPELPVGYAFGTVSDENPAPEGAKVVKTEKALLNQIAKVDAANEEIIKASETFEAPAPKEDEKQKDNNGKSRK